MNLDPDEWIVRRRGSSEIHALRRSGGHLAMEQTPYQLIEVVDTVAFGRALLLDGVYQSSEFDEALKHEVLVHPILSLPIASSLDVLIVGGGEGCVAREVLKHSRVRSAVMIEIDERVPAVCESVLGWDRGALRSNRLTKLFGDAAVVLADLCDEHRTFDVVIVDSTQPVEGSIAGSLATREFFRLLKGAMHSTSYLAGYGINAAPIGAPIRRQIRSVCLEVLGGKLIEYVVPCPFYSASFAFQLWTSDETEDVAGTVLRNFPEAASVGVDALDRESLVSYFAIPWGYRLAQ